MNFLDYVAATFCGNVLAIGFVWAIIQFHKHDDKAPFAAYAAVIFPLSLSLIQLILSR